MKIVNNIDDKKTNAPIPNASFTESGITPGRATSLTPKLLTKYGKLLAIQVPIPIINV